MENPNFWSETEGQDSARAGNPALPLGDPERIGRYRVVRRLGQGGFGRVYLARDDDLDRPVAIKVPNPERVAGAVDVEVYLAEARALAKLDHANIVPVHDVGRTGDGLCYVVSKYIEGNDLAERLRQGRPSFRESAELVAVVAGALHHAHTRGLVHRDVKPANILIDPSNEPWVADFGLALTEDDYGKGARQAGTPAYMSPEQARGEGNRVDGRSDIFSLGVVLYELLTGRKPFRGDSRAEVMDQIATVEPRPLRQIDDTIPRELERICQKALAKRASERYSTGRDLAEDLRHFLATELASGSPSPGASTISMPPVSTQEATPVPVSSVRSDSDERAIKIVPKGLRSFDRHDADFFLELLPGPRDRDGLPDGLRFWKTRIESTDPDSTFRVGLIYGPSGCGKSSLVKAGLLPRLSKDVLPVYIEATPEETEARLLRGLRKICPELPSGGTLVDALATLRRGHVVRPGQKVLLVIDQFEQWLLARRAEQNTELVAALRQCDGQHVQAIVMARDDFWMAATRFMRDLEIRLVEGENSAAVDLFDLIHARRVLTAFGRAYGLLPERASELTPEQRAFVEQSVAGLAQDGKVISVRLALFAEMVKGKLWTTTTLKDVGGTQGVGVTFLEETFSASTAPPEHRLHQKAARDVLKALLPRTGTDIGGQMLSEAELRDASGYASRPRDFDDLIGILDPELRLITPTDPEGSSGEVPTASPAGRRYYQLTHDYLVHSLRDWLNRKQRETRRGRAEMRLAERAAIWESKAENRHLPSLFEWASIRTLTPSKEWTDSERRMMRRGGWVHGLRTLTLAVVATVFSTVGLNAWIHEVQAKNSRAASAKNRVVQLLKADIADVPVFINEMKDDRLSIDPELKRVVQDVWVDNTAKLHASLALLPVDPTQAEYLKTRLSDAEPDEIMVLRSALLSQSDRLTPELWSLVESAEPGDPRLLPTAGALAGFDPTSPRWAEVAKKVARAIVTVNPILLVSWLDLLRPVRGRLIVPFAEVVRDQSRPETEQMLASNILADYANDDPRLLAELLVTGPQAFRALFSIVKRQVDKTWPVLLAELDATDALPPNKSDDEKDRLAERRARAAVALLRLNHAESVWPLLQHSADPRLRSFIVNWMKPMDVDPKVIAAEFDRINDRVQPKPAARSQTMDAVFFHPVNSMRRALIQALGTFGAADLSRDERERLIKKLLDLYRDDPDAGIHGAAEWTLRQWKQAGSLEPIDAQLIKDRVRGARRWYLTGQGQTFAVIDGPLEFHMGSPESDLERVATSEPEYQVTIPRHFAIATKEVTMSQFRTTLKTDDGFKVDVDTEEALKHYSPDIDGPWIGPNWYRAAAYCNWLSKQEGLPENQWCYIPRKDGLYAEGLTIPADALLRTGYRLPTEAEWEYACRAGTVTSRYYGVSVALLEKYAWYLPNGRERAWSVGSLLPNDLGLFDMLGNIYEWCQDGKTGRSITKRGYIDNISESESVINNRVRMIRGGMYTVLAREVRSAHRNAEVPTYEGIFTGFRVARTLP